MVSSIARAARAGGLTPCSTGAVGLAMDVEFKVEMLSFERSAYGHVSASKPRPE